MLNNDVSMTDPDWLHHLVRQARKPEVGAVGARLHYPDGTVQHAGVVLGVGGGAAHAHRGLPPGEPGYFHRADLPQFVSAVTAACLVVKRDKFLAVGGLDEDAFAVAFNDVDLCVRLNAAGWQSLYEPRAQLLHHESKSRGTDLTPEKKARFAGELARLKQRWQTDQSVDPFHHPALSRFSDTFVIDL
jgi:GT2 family glycosyltransferase